MSVDRRALEGMPMKLLITSVLISITLPSVLGALQGYEREARIEELKAQVQRIRSAALSAFLGGPGNIRTVPVDLAVESSGGGAAIELGGSPDSVESTAIRYYWYGTQLGSIFLLDPRVPIVPWTGGNVRIDAAHSQITLECMQVEDDTYIAMEMSSC